MKNYKKLYLEIDEEIVKILKEQAKEERVYLSAYVEQLLIKILINMNLIVK